MKRNKEKEEFLETEETTTHNELVEEQENEANENGTSDDEIIILKEKAAELNDKNLRLMAEFDNYRKRTLKERTDLLKTAGESILVNMLPLVDDFERGLKAMETAQDIDAVKEGVILIYEKFIGFLSQNGVKEIPTTNETFDTDIHEAVTTFPAPSEDMKGKIMDCMSKGYTMNDKVIRFPKVVVCE